jgi:FkbM family methyltransferase
MLKNKIRALYRFLLRYMRPYRDHYRYSDLQVSVSELKKLYQRPKGPINTHLFGKPLIINDAFWYLHGLREIFLDETYKFPVVTSPRIIDCGANTGLSLIYFRKNYPDARITAFEPDSQIFEILKKNMDSFGYQDIELVQKAVWNHAGQLPFSSDGAVGGRLVSNQGEGAMVECIRLKDLLNQSVDFLKIDIEGAEDDVIRDCRENLANVRNIFIEYHSSPGKPQSLTEILQILREAGFRVYLKEAWENLTYPFFGHVDSLYDLQLNIFAFRQEKIPIPENPAA